MCDEQESLECVSNDGQPNRTFKSASQVDPRNIIKITGLIKKEGDGTFAVAISKDGKEYYVPYSVAREALLPQLLDMYENDVECEVRPNSVVGTKKVNKCDSKA
ncbi:hypothetical protein TTRE_0000472901 [Trichuris trichiura]|uniref:Uncharacterized protein n=1 Tax=Trichuris trichiura TaxID=36087 RepID=A0A077Z9J1_TRITR|nr:hypothetical protein TTRE_0000472901 [Trichuris trichiura]